MPYLEGALPTGVRERLEAHLARCPGCREPLSRLRTGHEAGRELGRLVPDVRRRPPEFEALRARADGSGSLPTPSWLRLPSVLAVRPMARVLGVVLLALTVLLITSKRISTRGDAARADLSATARGTRSFTPLSIAAFEPNTKSLVVTEGLVTGVYFDEMEKTLHIKLVEPGEKTEPFVICEVRSPGRMAIPQEGNRVRVYGMARFDPQPGRGWNEVNPVTNIDILKR